jgi:hypothetical protein
LSGTYPSVGFRNAFCDYFLIAFLVASIPTIFTLIPKSIQQKVVAKSAEHELIELALDELVPVHFMHFIFAFPDGSLTA